MIHVLCVPGGEVGGEGGGGGAHRHDLEVLCHRLGVHREHKRVGDRSTVSDQVQPSGRGRERH